MTDASQRARTVVFLCVANSARSQMAEGLARASAPAGWRVFSAGSQPAVLHPLAVEVMREIGIDITSHRSKGLDEVPLSEADFVITLCADEVCPVVGGTTNRLHWPLPDPAAQGEMIRYQVEAFQNTRDEIRRRIHSFWQDQSKSAT
jgi:arsenate reductase